MHQSPQTPSTSSHGEELKGPASDTSLPHDPISEMRRNLEAAKELLPSLVEIVLAESKAAQIAISARLSGAFDSLMQCRKSESLISASHLSGEDQEHFSALRSGRSALALSALSLRGYADRLFVAGGMKEVSSLPRLNREQSEAAFSALPVLRERFWLKVYALPFVARSRIEELSAFEGRDKWPQNWVYRAKTDTRPESALQHEAHEIGEMYTRLTHVHGDPLPQDLRLIVAQRLITLPNSPETILLLGAEGGRKLVRLQQLEDELSSVYGPAFTEKAGADDRYSEYQKLRDEVGAAGVEAQESYNSLLSTREPYTRLRNFIFLTHSKLDTSSHVVFRRSSQDREDLGQGASLGILRAIDRFDNLAGFEFSTYAYGWIRHGKQEAGQHLRPNISVPLGSNALLYEIRNSVYPLGERSFLEQLSQRTNISMSTLGPLLQICRPWHDTHGRTTPRSTNYSVSDVADPSASQPTRPDEHPYDVELLARVLGTLPARDRELLIKHFGEELTHRDIAAQYNVSHQRISQILGRALRNVRQAFGLPT